MQNVSQQIDNHKAKVFRVGHFREDQIAHLKESANRQEKIIARVFWQARPQGLAPSTVHKLAIASADAEWPLTSTRRAISNLTDDHILVKTDCTKEGKYGRPESVWRWKTKEDFKIKEPEQGELIPSQSKRRAGVQE